MFGKSRVEEDLLKIKNSNLIYKQKLNEEIEINNEEIKLEKGDLTAIILAIMSLILPYIFAFIGIMGTVVYLLCKFYS